MISAKEARALAGPSSKDILDNVFEQIDKAAKSKKFNITLRDDIWSHGGYNNTPLYKECVDQLEQLGYTVKYFFDCGQFVDAGVTISWEKT